VCHAARFLFGKWVYHAAQMPLATNTILKKQFRIERFVGQGPSGFVYQGFNQTEERAVAIKTLRAALVRTPRAFAELLQPARIANEFAGAPLTEIYACFESEGRFVVVSEWIAGTTLKNQDSFRNLALAATLDLLTQCLDALAQLHGRGLVHANLKPSNILIGSDQVVKFSDLGLSVRHAEHLDALKYVAPEQLAGEPIDARADVYAMGVVARELLVPSLEQDISESAARAALTSLLPEPIAEVILRAVAQDPQLRYRDAVEFQKSFSQARHTVASSIRPAPDARADLARTRTSAAAPRSALPLRTSQPILLVTFFGLLAIAAVIGLSSFGLFANPFSLNPLAQNATLPQVSVVPPLNHPPPLTANVALTLATTTPTPIPTQAEILATPPSTAAAVTPLPIPTENILDLGKLSPAVEDSRCAFGLEEGAYVVRSRADRVICGAVFPETFSNVRIHARFKMTQGDGIGSGNTILTFGHRSPKNFFGISFTRVGRLYGVAQWKDNVPKAIVFYNWEETLGRPDEKGVTTNQVTLEIKDKQLTLWANGSLINVFSLQDFDYQGGQVGISVYTSDSLSATRGGASALERIVIEPLP